MGVQKIEILLAQNRYDMAYSELKSYLAGNPDDMYAQSMLAICCINLKKFDETKVIVENCMHREPWNPYFHFLKANYHAVKGEIDQGLKAIDEAISLDSYNEDYFDLKGRMQLAKSDYQGAEESAKMSLGIDPENQDSLNTLSKALIGQNRGKEAASVMDKALQANPENWETHANYGYRSLEQGKVKNAIEHFRNALVNDPNKLFAQQGMKLAMKAKFPLYRWLLQFQMYMSKQGKTFNIGFVIGLVIFINVLQKLQDNASGLLRYGIIAIIALLLLFVLSSWMLDPFMNLILYSNKNGRLSLSDGERNTAKFVGINLIVLIIGVLMFLITGEIIWVNLLGIFVLGLLCASGMWEREGQKGKVIAKGFYTFGSACFLLGIMAKYFGLIDFEMSTTIGVFTAVLYTWFGNSAFFRS